MTTKTPVSLLACASYTGDLQDACTQLLAPLGGMQAFVRPGQSVLLKPNLLTNRAPAEGVTTHPELVRAVVRLVRAAGASPCVADSPANVMKIEKVWEKTGLAGMCRDEDVPLLSLEEAGSVPFSVAGFSFTIAKPVLEADVVINLPKVKTHVLTILTAGVKNLYGTVPGYQKATLHKRNPSVKRFGALVAAIYQTVRPALTIADGVLAMEGDGPSAGRPKPLGLLAASPDAVALDAVLCELLGIPPRAVPYLAPLGKAGVGQTDLSRVALVGARLEDVRPASFKVPGTLRSRLIPAGLVRALDRWLWIRPSITDACVYCGQCVKACPVQALSVTGRRKPVLAPARCIGCCCCHEVCPAGAIEMAQSPLLNILRGGKRP